MKTIIYTNKAPKPIGSYSQGVMVNGMLYTSGQIAINPVNNELVVGDVAQETRQVMENVKQVLNAANMTFENVVKCSIFIANMEHFAIINEVYGSYFTSDFPARETVEVACLPKKVNVEISVIATL